MILPFLWSSRAKTSSLPLEDDKPAPPNDALSLSPSNADMFSFPPFPSPNPAAHLTSPLDSAGSTTSSASSSVNTSPSSSPSISPVPSHPRRQSVPPGTRIRKLSISLTESKSVLLPKSPKTLSKHSSPKESPRLSPQASSTNLSMSMSTSTETSSRSRRGSRAKAYEDAIRIGHGAWCEKKVRFDDTEDPEEL